jgi:hypothetical protein
LGSKLFCQLAAGLYNHGALLCIWLLYEVEKIVSERNSNRGFRMLVNGTEQKRQELLFGLRKPSKNKTTWREAYDLHLSCL